ncbi:hypothetical protein Hamer_G010244 [Homarus americanus]|uniref:Uncharacterized protein n=1 Tax=Homarus americanus TaxID=6706 RepID=A0A8J5MX75_HOMAM|nr:hypothetical protein Hamer_G010244 [Homarus americanus]
MGYIRNGCHHHTHTRTSLTLLLFPPPVCVSLYFTSFTPPTRSIMRLCVMFSCCLIVLLAFVYFSDAASNDKPRYSETEEVRRPKTPRNSKKSEGAKTKKRPGSPKSDQARVEKTYAKRTTCPTKCTKKGGVCQSQSSLCNGNLKKGKSWCGGKTCGCCLAKGACTAKNTCKKEGGVCQPASSECDGELKKDRKYCKGKSCGCCVPKKGEVMPAGHLISQDLNFISSLFCFSILTYDFLA